MLRARFRSRNGEPEQCINEGLTAGVSCFDVAGMEVGTLQQRVLTDSLQPFDLSVGPLIRANVYQRAEHEVVILLVFDHIACDGWSYCQILDELDMLLAVPNKDSITGPEVPTTRRNYLDYIEWQRQWLGSPAAELQRFYWEMTLASSLPILEWPADVRCPAESDCGRSLFTLTLPIALVQELRALSSRQAGTLFTTLLAAYQILLHRYTGQDEIVVGSPMSGRTNSDWDRVVGDFVNPIALLAQFDGDPTVSEILRRVRNTALRGMENQDYPFANLVEQFHSSRTAAVHPLFQTMFVFQKVRCRTNLRALWDVGACTRRIQWGGVELTSFPAHQSGGNSAIGLVLEAIEVESGVRCDFKFDTGLFNLDTIKRLAGSFERVLAAMVVDDAQRIGHLSLLSATERHQVLVEFNATKAPYPSEQLVHQLFEEQVVRNPQATAVVYEDEELSYAELNARANQLAHHLIGLGVGPDDRVAICVERSLEMVVGLLGILKAGGAYVPLDPSYPAERLAYMLLDSAPVALLTQVAVRESLPAVKVPLIVLDGEQDLSTLTKQPDHNPDPLTLGGLNSHHLAYVIYTSGSTGTPKGVMVEHANVSRLFAATEHWFGFNSTDVWALFHSFAFDFSVWEIWGALLYGGRLVIVPALCTRAPEEFYGLLCREGVTVLNQTPSAFRQLIGVQSQSEALHTLRHIIFGGEALELRMLAPWLKCNDPERTRLINMYGITEITVHATYRHITGADVLAEHGSVIGKAIPGLQIYLLDWQRQPVPVGVTGELYIGGVQVARGYLNRPELTAERFIADPFGADPDARMYKTGDLGRWLADGNIEYLGRNDFQVKIRGFRIELGEIEAKLAEHEGVREAVVIAREDSPGQKHLVAYVVVQAGVKLSAAELRSHLAGLLPEYMVPSAFVNLEGLPLTPNGKLDRRALPAPGLDAVVTRRYEAPQGVVETAIARVWQELLNLDRVGRHDHFFELGGHSLMVISLIERLRQQGISADVRTVFSAPTLAALATAVVKREGLAPALVVPPNLIQIAFEESFNKQGSQEFRL